MTDVRAPRYDELPVRKKRATRCGPELCEVSVNIEVTTPILGGGTAMRALDDIDVIRAPTVRGHLRFWWRALHGHRFETAEELYKAESRLFGRAGDEKGGRSAIDLRVNVVKSGEIDESDIRLYGANATKGAYALFPAKSQHDGTPTAPRRIPGTRFCLSLVAPKDKDEEGGIRNVVRAWLLFGGYGGRTRRGLGSFTVVEGRDAWLPKGATRDAFSSLFGRDVFALSKPAAFNLPLLAGASLLVGEPKAKAEDAWTSALKVLAEFRQGTSGEVGSRAREPGANNRPSISNWPEADKIRRLTRKTRGHEPRHNATPAWPRAGFGLPIVGRFQDKARDGGRIDEPGPFTLEWRDDNGTTHNRLASPLILKALPLADGKFVPCALWLNRAYPDGEVILDGFERSGAPFDRLVADGDKPLFNALAGKTTLRQAFLDWLKKKSTVKVVAP